MPRFGPVSNEECPVDLEDALDVEALGPPTLRAGRAARPVAHEDGVVLHIWGGHTRGGGSHAARASPPTPAPPKHPQNPSPWVPPFCLPPKAPQNPILSPCRATSLLAHLMQHPDPHPAPPPAPGGHSQSSGATAMGPGSSGKVPWAVLSAASRSSRTRGTRGGGPMVSPDMGGHPPHLWARGQVGGGGSTHPDAWVPSPSRATDSPTPVAPAIQTHHRCWGPGGSRGRRRGLKTPKLGRCQRRGAGKGCGWDWR